MDFAASLSSSPERHGGVESQLGVIQQPWDTGQDSATRSRNWLMLGKFRAMGISDAECVLHKSRVNYSHRLQSEGQPLRLSVYNLHNICGRPGTLQGTLWLPSFIFYELAVPVSALAGNRMDPPPSSNEEASMKELL